MMKLAAAALAFALVGGAAVAAEKCACCKDGEKMACCDKMQDKPAAPKPGETPSAPQDQPQHQH